MSDMFPNPALMCVAPFNKVRGDNLKGLGNYSSNVLMDLSTMNKERLTHWLNSKSIDDISRNIKLSPECLHIEDLPDILGGLGVTGIWVELCQYLQGKRIYKYLATLAELASNFQVFPILSHMELIKLIMADYPIVKNLALKGNEASGFVSSESAMALFCFTLELSRKSPEPFNLNIWGGVATPEAASAFIVLGARTIVFESLHWMTDLVDIGDHTKSALSKLKPEHSELINYNGPILFRVFNRGNSAAVKEARRCLAAEAGNGDSYQVFVDFSLRMERIAKNPLEADFSRNEIIPMGVEAAFAEMAQKRFGREFGVFVDRFSNEVNNLVSRAQETWDRFVNNPSAKKMGLRYPIIQGAMSWISDNPDFAKAIAEQGAAPTFALAAMDAVQLNERFGDLSDLMGTRPYAVNVLTLPENPLRAAQLEWIKQNKPPFAVIAGGDLASAKELLDSGIEVIYLTPGVDMIVPGANQGIRYFVLEGNEAGGHVGEQSLLTMAQTLLWMKYSRPEIFKDLTIVYAGGIYNGDSAFIATMLGADMVQMGTAYLATREIVETQALTELYQELVVEAKPGDTVVSGGSLGLGVRSLGTPQMKRLCELDREILVKGPDEFHSRSRMEKLSAMSLFKAAHGLDSPLGDQLNRDQCLDQGQFMCGACAGAIDKVRTIAELHREITTWDFKPRAESHNPAMERDQAASWIHGPGKRFKGASKGNGPRTDNRSQHQNRIVITGMEMVNSLGNGLEEIWKASLDGESGITRIPHHRWDHSKYYDPRPLTPEKTYCDCAAFMDMRISRNDIDVPPQDFRTMTEATKLTLLMGRRIVEGSGILDSDVPRERIGVIVSQNPGGVSSKSLTDMVLRDSMKEILSAVGKVTPLNSTIEYKIRNELLKGRMVLDDTSLLGRLASAAAGFICGKYGFSGPSFSVAAACATSAMALFTAIQMIRTGLMDAALIGGAEALLTGIHFLEFSSLGALAGITGKDWKPEQSSRPFDADRDGMVLGEGGGMILIEREETAIKRGAPILAYITGIGAATNHLDMVEPSGTMVEQTIRQSFNDLEYGPEAIGYVECHATSTMAGDTEEIIGIKRVFSKDSPIIVSSFKSQIGHTLGASAVTSLIRAVMALNGGIVPPSINCDAPDPELNGNGYEFMVPGEPVQWPKTGGSPRRVMVNSFGFGGSSCVVHLEQAFHNDDLRMPLVPCAESGSADHGNKEYEEFSQGVFLYRTEVEGRPHLVGIVADNDHEARKLFQNQAAVHTDQVMTKARMRALNEKGIYLALEKEATPRVGFIFPGQGAQYPAAGKGLYREFPVVRKWIDRGHRASTFDLKGFLFDSPAEELIKPPFLQPAMLVLEVAIAMGLMGEGIEPIALAGHSGGELAALCHGGVFSFEDGVALAMERSRLLESSAKARFGPTSMIAVNMGQTGLKQIIAKRPDTYITNINSDFQTVVAGPVKAMDKLKGELDQLAAHYTVLNVDHAFHLPLREKERAELERFVSGIEISSPKIPTLSNVTGRAYPSDPDEIRKLIVAQAESPVNWRENLLTLERDHRVDLLLEAGPGRVLRNLASETVERIDSISTCLKSDEVAAYRGALAWCYAKQGIPTKRNLWFLPFPKAKNTKKATKAHKSASSPLAQLPKQELDLLGQVIRQEIEAFVLETSGRYLKDNIIESMKNRHNRAITREELELELISRYPTLDNEIIRSTLNKGEPKETPGVGESDDHPSLSTGPDDITEALIRIIMDCTGYERFEIEPDMNLRRDLAIRSSRIPVIIHAIESHFHIKVRLEQFIEARTIQDVANSIAPLIKDGVSGGSNAADYTFPSGDPGQEPAGTTMESLDLRRLIQAENKVGAPEVNKLDLSGETVIILKNAGDKCFDGRISRVLKEEYNASAELFNYSTIKSSLTGLGLDTQTESGPMDGGPLIGSVGSPAGLIMILGDSSYEPCCMDEITGLITGLFTCIKAFLKSESKRFCLLVHEQKDPDSQMSIVREALGSALLTCGREFESINFKTVVIGNATDLEMVLELAMGSKSEPAHTTWKNGEAFTNIWTESDSRFQVNPKAIIGPGDTIVLSGGARGVTSQLAKSLAPFGVRFELLGTTKPYRRHELLELGITEGSDEGAICQLLAKAKPDLSQSEFQAEVSRVMKSFEINGTIDMLRSMGSEVEYTPCDVTNETQVQRVFKEFQSKGHNIAGIVSAAGIIRDSLITGMSREDFSEVVKVKILGAWNMFKYANSPNLKFFVGLSSIAVMGNPGQVNYSAANKGMGQLIKILGAQNPHILCKVLNLPPIQGAGMADTEDIRELLRLKSVDYIHVTELAQLFLRELFIAPTCDIEVTFGKGKTATYTESHSGEELGEDPDSFQSAALSFPKSDFPMIKGVSSIDFGGERIETICRYSRKTHHWLEDHDPGGGILKHPIVSGVMALETLMEASKILYPYLVVQGAKDVEFLNVMEVPSEIDRVCEVSCQRALLTRDNLTCTAELKAPEISPTGRIMDKVSTYYRADIIMGPGLSEPGEIDDWSKLPEREMRKINGDDQVLRSWKPCEPKLKGRYADLCEPVAIGSGLVRSRVFHRVSQDVQGTVSSSYQYPVYILEALIQTCCRYLLTTQEAQGGWPIPFKIGQVYLFARPEQEDTLYTEARVISRENDQVIWDASVVDKEEKTIMSVKGLITKIVQVPGISSLFNTTE